MPILSHTIPLNGNAYDISGNENNGTVYGATLDFDRFGNPNSAYSFDGVSDYISTNSALFDDFSEVSISAWIKTTDLSGPILNNFYSENTSAGVGLRVLNGGKANLAVDITGGGNNQMIESSFEVADNLWHHIVGVFNDTTDTAQIFIDGELAASGAITISPSVENETYLIGRNGFGNCYLNGSLDDIRIYNNALTGSEIQQLYNPVPEPTTMLLLGTGLLGLAGVRRRRK